MTETKILPLLTWRQAVAKSSLPPTSRLVALTLSLYMNEMGGSAFPGAALLAENTGLSVKAVRGHLRGLVDAGWLVLVERGGLKGERKKANAYQAVIPNGGTTVTHARGNVTTPMGEPNDPDGGTTFTPSLQELSTNSGNLTQTTRQSPKRGSYSPSEDFTPTDVHCEYARQHGLSVDDELAHWLDWCTANGRKYKNLNAGFSTWLRQAVGFGRGGAPVASLDEIVDEPKLVLPPARVEVCPVCDSSLLAHRGGVPCPS